MEIREQDEKLLSFSELQSLIPLGRTKLYALMKKDGDNRLPKPVKIGFRSFWRKSQVLNFIKMLR